MVGHEGGRILVTGALGQIGTDLVQSLRYIYGSDNVIASDIREKKDHPCIQNGPYINLDVLDKDRIFKIVVEKKVKIIYHLAAILSAKGEENPDLCELINVEGTRNILRLLENSIYVFLLHLLLLYSVPIHPKMRPKLLH